MNRSAAPWNGSGMSELSRRLRYLAWAVEDHPERLYVGYLVRQLEDCIRLVRGQEIHPAQVWGDEDDRS